MKKIFNHRKRPYEDKIDYQEWEETFSEEEEGYYAEGEDGYDYGWEEPEQPEYTDEAVYAAEDGEYVEDAEYYEEDDTYYEEDGEYYVDEEGMEVVSADGYEDGYEDGYYVEDPEDMLRGYDDMEYMDDTYYEDEEEEKRGFLGFLSGMGLMDKIIALTGVIVLAVALITGGIYASRHILDEQVESFVSVGSQLAQIRLPGEMGLLAIADAQAARQAAADALKEQEQEQDKDLPEYNEQDYKNAVSVYLRLSSIQKDLKVKFTNQKTGKLISNVPFSITVTDPDGKETVWTDDDMDGIIYKTDLKPGKYSISVQAFSSDKYKDYSLPTYAQQVEVKKDIEYKKVDVSNEIKSETEVDVSKEDTKKNETQIENKLQDTVSWVESTTTLITYAEVEKATIKDPATLVVLGNFVRLSQVLDPSLGSLPETLTSQETPSEPSSESSSEPSVPSEPSSEEPSSEPSASSTPSSEEPSSEPSSSPDPGDISYVGKISESSKALQIGESFTLTASAEGVNLTQVTWSTSNPSVATVDSNGVVTAAGEGMAIISYTAEGAAVSGGNAVSGLQGSCQVTVTKAQELTKGNLVLHKTEAAVAVNKNTVVKATVSDFAEGKELEYLALSADNTVATAAVDPLTGEITIVGLALGETTVTVSVDYAEGGSDNTKVTAQIKVTVVGDLKITLEEKTATVYLETPLILKVTIENKTTEDKFTVVSSDTTIAKAEVKEDTIVITGVKEGTANITVTYKEGTTEVTAVCAVVVKTDPKLDKVTKLEDAEGNQVYVKEGTEYREAVYADYYTANKFYIKGEAKYTGWQTLDGKVYYFDSTGKKVTGEQVIQGAKYNFGKDGALNTGTGKRGIDVSKWNGNIDWKAVKNSGIEYVIIRCGYRGSSKGVLVEDPKFVTNIKGATAAGLKVGVYFFTQAVSEAEAVEEASMVLELIRNYKISYPVFLDVEASGGRADGIDKTTRTAVCQAFCKTIQSGGYTAGIYANKTWLTEKIDTSKLSAYKIWLAQYASAPTYTGRYDLWQYQSTGKVSGISGNVDMNWSYLGY